MQNDDCLSGNCCSHNLCTHDVVCDHNKIIGDHCEDSAECLKGVVCLFGHCQNPEKIYQYKHGVRDRYDINHVTNAKDRSAGMSTTIGVLTLACIIVVFMMIKKAFKNNHVAAPKEEEENDNVTAYRPPTEFRPNDTFVSARSTRSNQSVRSPTKSKKILLPVAKVYETDSSAKSVTSLLSGSDLGGSKKGGRLKKRKKPTGVARSLIKEIPEPNLAQKTRKRSANRLVDSLVADNKALKAKLRLKIPGVETEESKIFGSNQKYEFMN